MQLQFPLWLPIPVRCRRWGQGARELARDPQLREPASDDDDDDAMSVEDGYDEEQSAESKCDQWTNEDDAAELFGGKA